MVSRPVTSRIVTLSAGIAFSCLLILAFAFSCRTIDSPDAGLHLSVGKRIVDTHSFPDEDEFTYTISGREYVDTYWLYQITLALAERAAGPAGPILLNGLMIVCTLMLFSRRFVAPDWPHKAAALGVLLWMILVLNYELRPHVVSWLYLSALLYLLERYDRDRTRTLIGVPLIMLMWVNTQPTFILGWLVIVSFAAGLLFEKRSLTRIELSVFASSVLVCFVNPYFHRGVFLPFTQFGFLQEASIFKQIIAEYSPPTFVPLAGDFLLHGKMELFRAAFLLKLLRLAVLSLFLLQAVRRRIRVHEAIGFVLLLYIDALAVKNAWYFLLAVTPFLFNSLSWAEPSSGSTLSRVLRRLIFSKGATIIMFSGLSFLVLTLSLRIVTDGYYASNRYSHRFGFGYNELMLPVRATDFLLKNHLDGRILNHINFGGYFMDHLPQKIFIDGRNEVTGELFAGEYQKTLSNSGIAEVVQRYDPVIAVFPHKEGLSWLNYFMADTAQWRLVYFDELAAVYLHNSYAPVIPRVQASLFENGLHPLSAERLDLVLSKEFGGFLNEFIRRQYVPVAESEQSVFCYYNHWYAEAVNRCVAGIERSTLECPELYFNLAVYLTAEGDNRNAERCLDWISKRGYSMR